MSKIEVDTNTVVGVVVAAALDCADEVAAHLDAHIEHAGSGKGRTASVAIDRVVIDGDLVEDLVG